MSPNWQKNKRDMKKSYLFSRRTIFGHTSMLAEKIFLAKEAAL
jgi:hypothetical protein